MNLQLEGWWSAKQGCFKDTGTPLAPPGDISQVHTEGLIGVLREQSGEGWQ